MSGGKLPAIQFYPGDWKKDLGVQALDFHDRGVWFEMLLMMHESGERGVLLLNGRPLTDDALARSLGLDKQILTTTLTKLLDYGVAHRRQSDGAIFNKRMVRDEEIRQLRRSAGLQGGNPVLLKQNPTTEVKQNPTPSYSFSISSSTSISKKPTAPKREVVFPPKLDNQRCRDAWKTWIEYKAKKRQGYKDEGSQEAQLARWKDDPEGFIAAVDFSRANGWSGLFADDRNSKTSSRPVRHGRYDVDEHGNSVQFNNMKKLWDKAKAQEEAEERANQNCRGDEGDETE